jgi:hypothetical protein
MYAAPVALFPPPSVELSHAVAPPMLALCGQFPSFASATEQRFALGIAAGAICIPFGRVTEAAAGRGVPLNINSSPSEVLAAAIDELTLGLSCIAGGPVSTTKYVAALGVLETPLTNACTANPCEVDGEFAMFELNGELHGKKSPPSTWQLNVVPGGAGSTVENSNCWVSDAVTASGAESIFACAEAGRTVKVEEASAE